MEFPYRFLCKKQLNWNIWSCFDYNCTENDGWSRLWTEVTEEHFIRTQNTISFVDWVEKEVGGAHC